jgi:hypothetical protein
MALEVLFATTDQIDQVIISIKQLQVSNDSPKSRE